LTAVITFAQEVKQAIMKMEHQDRDYARAVGSYLALACDRLAENCSSVCRWNGVSEKLQGTFGRQALPMVWDYCETSPFGGSVGDWCSLIGNQVNGFANSSKINNTSGKVVRSSADQLAIEDERLELVATDPPYYDSVPYSDLSDFFYVWLKRTIGDLYPDVFRTDLTPKTRELIAYYGKGDRKINKPPS